MTTSRNPQTDTPDNLGSIRGRISPDSDMDLREQIRLYAKMMGTDALTRQMALRRAERNAGRIKKF